MLFVFCLYRDRGQCTIQFDEYVVITGGIDHQQFSTSATVAAYNDYGDRRDLQPLVEGRGFHGCGHYIDNDGNMVNIPYLKFLKKICYNQST